LRVAVIEHLDAVLPDILALEPDVVIITGDHSAPGDGLRGAARQIRGLTGHRSGIGGDYASRI